MPALEVFKYIPRPSDGRRFVIADIHGCYHTFRALIFDVIDLRPEDQLFLLGDYVDKGPDSKGVLDLILFLRKSGFQVFPLRGNHEEMLLEYNNEEFRFLEWHLKKNKSLNLLKGQKIRKRYRKFFQSLAYYYILDNFFLVHGGFDFRKENPFDDLTSMIWYRGMEPSAQHQGNRIIVHGHQPTYMEEIRLMVETRNLVICLDNGAVYNQKRKNKDVSRLGNLIALNLDTFEMHVQPNIDIPVKESV